MGETPKKIDDLGVFSITATSSVFAYIWLFVCLQVWTPNEITLVEAFLTLFYFLFLIVLAYVADRHNAKKKKASENVAQTELREKDELKKTARADLIKLSDKKGKEYVIDCVRLGQTKENQQDYTFVEDNFRLVLETEDLKS